jgi:uncharacterized protein
MSDKEIQPISTSERIDVIDVLRGLAVCGILIGNMQWFTGYGMMPPAVAQQAPFIDHVTHFLVHFFIEGKFYSIFSFLFGFGFALQIARAEERGDTEAKVFKRRLLWLLVIGAIHAIFLWPGDILSVYAVIGFLLILFRKKSDRSLLKWTAALMLVPIVTYVIIYILFVAFVPASALSGFESTQADMWNGAVRTAGQGSYLQVLREFNPPYLLGRWAGLIVQMRLPKILAMFLLGLYVYRRGYFQNLQDHKAFIRKVLVYGLALGIAGHSVFAAFSSSEADLPPTLSGLVGVISYSFGVPALALGYIALVVTLWQSSALQRILAMLAPVGRMALTNYLLQTVTCLAIFYGYGFGWFGRVGATSATVIALTIFAIQIFLSSIWLKYFDYGPMEWIWRQLTYRRRLPLRAERLT